MSGSETIRANTVPFPTRVPKYRTTYVLLSQLYASVGFCSLLVWHWVDLANNNDYVVNPCIAIFSFGHFFPHCREVNFMRALEGADRGSPPPISRYFDACGSGRNVYQVLFAFEIWGLPWLELVQCD